MADVVWLSDGGSTIIAKEVLGSRAQYFSLNNPSTFNVTVEVEATKAQSFCERMLAYRMWLPDELNLALSGYYCTDARLRFVDSNVTVLAGAQFLSYQGKALVDLTYQALPGLRCERESEYYGTDEGIFYVEEEFKPSALYYPMPANALVWGKLDGSGTALKYALAPGEEPPITQPHATLTRTIHGYITFSMGWTELLGTVNTAEYVSDFDLLTFSAGTLLLRTLDIKRNNNNFNSSARSIIVTVAYEYNPIGWNMFYHIDVDPTKTGWYDIRYAKDLNTTYEPFPDADHGDFLFNTIAP